MSMSQQEERWALDTEGGMLPNIPGEDTTITYNPDDIDTYPSVCSDPESVKTRFGWTGGEQFTHREIDDWFEKGLPPKACRSKEHSYDD